MAPDDSSRDFLRLFYSSGKDLISDRFYDALDSDPDDTYNYNDKCNEIVVKSNKDKLVPICIKYQRFLDKCLAWSDLNSQYNVSLLLSYWLYEKLINIYGDTNSEEISFGFSALQWIWDLFPYGHKDDAYYKKCKPELNLVEHTDWKKRKELYDYFINYNYLSMMAKFHDNDCKYYKKIEEKKSLYNHFAQRCASGGDDCPDFYAKCTDYDPNIVLSTLPCHSKMVQANASLTADTKESSSHHPAGPEARRAVSGDGPGETDPTVSLHSTQSTPKSSDIGTKVSHSVLGAAPVLLTATMLYRYTPLGPWIRKLRGINPNSMNAMDTLSPYTQETGDMFSDESANYISYQPI